MGRPPKPAEDLLRHRVVAHLRDADFAALEQWAIERGVQTGELVRELVEKAVRRRKR